MNFKQELAKYLAVMGGLAIAVPLIINGLNLFPDFKPVPVIIFTGTIAIPAATAAAYIRANRR